MEYFVVYLKCKRYIVIPKHWVKNPVLRQESTIFFSGNGFDSTPDFSCEKKHYVDDKENACYDAFVFKSFDNYEAAQNFALNKRVVAPVQYKTLGTFDFSPVREPVDLIEISDSDISEPDSGANNIPSDREEDTSIEQRSSDDIAESAPNVRFYLRIF